MANPAPVSSDAAKRTVTACMAAFSAGFCAIRAGDMHEGAATAWA